MAMVIRFRSKDGMLRLNTDPSKPFGSVVDELKQKLPSMDTNSLKISSRPGEPGQKAADIRDQTVGGLNLKHGDMLYLDYDKATATVAATEGASATVNISSNQKPTRKQLKVDDTLDKEEGLIPRKRTSLCRHTDKGMCEYCSPLPPWDKVYQEEKNIKHISFHAYVNELNSVANKLESGSSYVAPLSESDFKINKRCPSGHDAWPRGICSKCQPSAITLQRQKFRMVDHVEFQDSEIVNDFINAWRLSGAQRIGLMLGTYDKYEKVPLGIKAKVEAIYELPQADQEDGVALQSWEDEQKVLALADELGLVPVGIVFTDLVDAGSGDGSVICKRHRDSFFLSSLEAIFAIKWQLKFRNVCKWSQSGFFSSKFVTCVISGNTRGEIDIEAYQISESGEALVKADLIAPTTHPNEVYIQEQNSERYVPEIFFQRVNEYGLEVKQSASTSFPVEYLLVSLTHGFPEQSSPRFKRRGFPIENRGYIGEGQEPNELQKYLRSTDLGEALSNFHVLVYLVKLDVLSPAEVSVAVRCASSNAEESSKAVLELLSSAGWQSLQTILSFA